MMKKVFIVTFALFLIFGMTFNSNAQSNEELSVMTAKAFSMGGAFTGVADDVGAVLFNPAGLTQSGIVGLQGNGGLSNIDTKELNKIRDFASNVSGDINFEDVLELKDSFPESTSLNIQAFGGANLKSVALSGAIKSNYDVYTDNGENVLGNNNDITGIISYGAKLASPPVEVASLAYGFNIKMTQHNYNEYRLLNNDNLATIEAKGNSIDLDFGVLAKVTDIFKVGAQIENFYSSGYDLEGKKIISSFNPVNKKWEEESSSNWSDSGDKIKRNLRIGASVEVPVVGTTLAADLENITALSQTEGAVYHLGLQQNLFLNLISVRAGTYGPMNEEDSSQEKMYTAGLGINLTKLHLDLAVGTNENTDNLNGMISGRFKF